MGHVHEGHRARLRERLSREGLDHFQPHEVIELLLFYCIPVRNVNQLAHELVNRFGSVGGVLGAAPEALLTVPGVGAATADWLSSLGPLLDEYLRCRLSDRPQLTRAGAAAEYAQRLMPALPDQQFWALALSQSGHLLGSAQIATGGGIRNPPMRELVNFLLRYRTQRAVIIQRRLPADMEADERDVEIVSALEALLPPLRIVLMDVLLVCGHRHLSLHRLRIVKPQMPYAILSEAQPAGPDAAWLDE